MDDQELLKCLERFPDGPPITLYHVDVTGNLVAALDRGGQVDLRPGEFWLTTNVETRAGFKGGAGLDNVIAYQIDRRFVMLLAELAQDQRTGAVAEKGLKAFFGVDLAVPRVNFEGGGKGVKLPEGEVNIALRMTRAAPEFNRMFQLSVKRTTHLRYNDALPPGQRLVPVKPLDPWNRPKASDPSDPNSGFSGKTPGYDQSGDALIMGAHAIIKDGAVKANMGAAGALAWAGYLNREREIYDLQRANPCFGVQLVFYFQYQPAVNADFADAYYFHELTINSLANSYKGSLMGLEPRGQRCSFSVIIPALKARDASCTTPPITGPDDPFWIQTYRNIKNALDSPRQDYQACLSSLNGCAMYDILRILVKLVNDRYFNYLENQLVYATGIGTARLKSAFLAVRASWNSGSAFSYYKTSCKEFVLLGDGDKTSIEDFLTGGSSTDGDDDKKAHGVPEWLTGWWTVWDGNYYYYYFTNDFAVGYVKSKPSPKAPAPKTPNNKGRFTLAEHGPKIVWNAVDGSSTIETFTQRDWSSQTEMNGVSSKYSPLYAKKLM
jgi:hypothetical protein